MRVHTVTAKEIAIELAVMAAWLVTFANTAQKKAVVKVLKARDFLLPRGVSIIHAPSYRIGQLAVVAQKCEASTCKQIH